VAAVAGDEEAEEEEAEKEGKEREWSKLNPDAARARAAARACSTCCSSCEYLPKRGIVLGKFEILKERRNRRFRKQKKKGGGEGERQNKNRKTEQVNKIGAHPMSHTS
jgi:hypothetical protein